MYISNLLHHTCHTMYNISMKANIELCLVIINCKLVLQLLMLPNLMGSSVKAHEMSCVYLIGWTKALMLSDVSTCYNLWSLLSHYVYISCCWLQTLSYCQAWKITVHSWHSTQVQCMICVALLEAVFHLHCACSKNKHHSSCFLNFEVLVLFNFGRLPVYYNRTYLRYIYYVYMY